MIDPITATPTAPPMVRKKLVTDVAEPSTERGTALWTAMSIGTKTKPMPTPAIIMSSIAAPRVRASFQPASSTNEVVRKHMPVTTTVR